MKIELHKLLNKYFSVVYSRIILVNKFTISSFFKYKDTLPLMSRSSVIYKYVCSDCEAEYVGVTSRALHMRVAEHRGRSFRTNNILANPSHSSIRAHCEGTCNTPLSSSGFTILHSAPDFVSLRILESLYIFKLNPSINDTNSSFPLYIVKFFFIIFFSYFLSSNMLYFNVPVFYHYSAYFYRALFKKLHCFTHCIIYDETSISKRLNKDDPFTNRLRFNLPNTIRRVILLYV